MDEPGLPNPVQPRLFCVAGWLRGACWLPPGSPNRRHPPAAWPWPLPGAAPAWGCCDRTALCAGAAGRVAGAAAVERLDMPAPDIPRCCSANGTRAAGLGCWCAKKCVLALERGTLVTARFENRRLALVGVIAMAPRTMPAWPIWLPEK